MRKRFLVWFVTILSVFVFCMAFSACDEGKAEDVVITVENATDGQTLLSYMESLQEDGKITFTVQDGMMVKINGTSNKMNAYWMLYTTDMGNADTSWGTYIYNGKTLGSAIYGAESLVIKNGETYVWTYQTF